MRMRHGSRYLRRALIALALAGLALAVACGDGDAPAATPEPATPTATPKPPPRVAKTATATPQPAGEAGEEGMGEEGMRAREIRIEGSTLIFRSDTELPQVERMMQVLRASDATVDTLLINSPGGDTRAGREIGEWVYDNQITVVVEELCASSCANYVFPAGKAKVIRKDAIVGWHGSDQQTRYLAQLEGIPFEEYLKREFDQLKMQEAEQGFDDDDFTFEVFKQDEQAGVDAEVKFLEKIGLDVKVMIYGFLPGAPSDAYRNARAGFWTFTIEGMNTLGIDNITYEGEGAYPSAASLRNFPDVYLYTEVTE